MRAEKVGFPVERGELGRAQRRARCTASIVQSARRPPRPGDTPSSDACMGSSGEGRPQRCWQRALALPTDSQLPVAFRDSARAPGVHARFCSPSERPQQEDAAGSVRTAGGGGPRRQEPGGPAAAGAGAGGGLHRAAGVAGPCARARDAAPERRPQGALVLLVLLLLGLSACVHACRH